MGQGALSKPVVQWWLSLNSSKVHERKRMFMNVLNSKFMNERQAKLSAHERNSEFMNEMNIHPSRIARFTHQIHYVDASIHINQRMNNKYI